mgnify:CR=1 FL=1
MASFKLTVLVGNKKQLTFTVLPSTTLGDLKCRICDQEGLAADKQLLVFNDKVLRDDSSTLDRCQIKPGHQVQLLQLAEPLGPLPGNRARNKLIVFELFGW